MQGLRGPKLSTGPWALGTGPAAAASKQKVAANSQCNTQPALPINACFYEQATTQWYVDAASKIVLCDHLLVPPYGSAILRLCMIPTLASAADSPTSPTASIDATCMC